MSTPSRELQQGQLRSSCENLRLLPEKKAGNKPLEKEDGDLEPGGKNLLGSWTEIHAKNQAISLDQAQGRRLQDLAPGNALCVRRLTDVRCSASAESQH